MSVINLNEDEIASLDAIEERELDRLIDDALRSGRPDCLRRLPLGRCGQFVSGRLRSFEQALSRFDESKSAAKRSRTEGEARRAGSNLSNAVSRMKHRKDEEERYGKLFRVEDRFIYHPMYPGKQMSVTVGYRWRRSKDEDWIHGSIEFIHHHDPRPDYVLEASRAKLSAARRQREDEDKLRQVWERFKDSALYSLRDYFQDGGDGSKVPASYKATVDAHYGTLNNYSTRFWLEQDGPAKTGGDGA